MDHAEGRTPVPAVPSGGTDRLRTAAAELHGLPVEELCDALLDRLVDRSGDDVVLLAARVRE